MRDEITLRCGEAVGSMTYEWGEWKVVVHRASRCVVTHCASPMDAYLIMKHLVGELGTHGTLAAA